MVTFEEHADWMAEYLNGLGYFKIVRCKECKWCKAKKSTTATKHCQWWHRAVRNNDFCSKGEK
jgi:hypothetical protein